MKSPQESPVWRKTSVANLVRYTASGVYFARVRVRGKLIRQSLKTDVLSVAQLRLNDLVKSLRHSAEGQKRTQAGKMTFGDVQALYEERLKTNKRLKPSSIVYRQKCIDSLARTWPELGKSDVAKLTEGACLAWAESFQEEYSPSRFNNTVGTLRHILEIAVKSGARYGNPALAIKKAKLKPKQLSLPEAGQFTALIKEIERGGGRFSQHCAELVQFLAFGGFRITEAANVTWDDCDFVGKQIIVRGDPITGTKNSELRRVPMNPSMLKLLKMLKSKRNDAHRPFVMQVRECQKSLDSGCRIVGLKRITHHDLRHLFATRCIEAGVDIPTVSHWLGHKDGGALAMKTYGHLRNEHSQAMAKKVKF